MSCKKPDTIFQMAYDAIDSLGTPVWLKNFLGEVQEIIIAIAFQIGKTAVDAIIAKVIEVGQENISGELKFKKVFDFIRDQLKLDDLKDSAVRLLIEAIVSKLKKAEDIP